MRASVVSAPKLVKCDRDLSLFFYLDSFIQGKAFTADSGAHNSQERPDLRGDNAVFLWSIYIEKREYNILAG